MTTASDKLKQMGQLIAEKREQASAIGAVFKFILEGDGGGNFIVNLKDTPGVVEGEGTADCTITMTALDFVALTEGKANGQELFFTGKLKVEGDMSLALRLQAMLDILK
ncbi:MAG TPA: SCP2 sterol-binding domain-containing protein [Polyangiaceae bacterium]